MQSGESYEEAASREYEEELGSNSEIRFTHKALYDDPFNPGLKKFVVIYEASHNGPFNFNEEELAAVEFLSLDKIKHMLDLGEKFHPELTFLLQEYYLA